MRNVLFKACFTLAVLVLSAFSLINAAILEVGPGKTYLTIQAAIDAAAPGDVIKVYPGVYDQDEANNRNPYLGGAGSNDFNIFIDKPVVLKGVDAAGNDILNYNDVAAFVVAKRNLPTFGTSAIFIQAGGVTIQGLDVTTFEAPYPYNGKTIEASNDNFTIRYCKIHALDQAASVYISDFHYNTGTDVSTVQTYRIENCYINGGGPNATGIRIASGAGWTGSASNRFITGNMFFDNRDAIAFVGPGAAAWELYPVGSATITNNSFLQSERRHVVAWGIYNSSPGYGPIEWNNILFNNGNSFDKGASTWQSDGTTIRTWDAAPFMFVTGIYSKIQTYAVTKAQSGDIVKVLPGIYNETVTGDLKNQLTLIGTNAITRPIINGSSHFSVCNDLRLENLILRNTSASPVAYIGGLNFTMNNVTVDGENIPSKFGITGGQINGNISITNSEFLNIRQWAAFDTRSGSGGPLSGSILNNVIFTGNLIENTVGHINFRGTISTPTPNVIISNNIVRNVGNSTNSFGGIIKVFYANSCDFTNNIIKDVGTSGYYPTGEAAYGAGFMPRNVSSLNVTGNLFENNNQGMAFEPRNSNPGGFPDGVLSAGSISNNIFMDNAYGIYIPATLHPTSDPLSLLISNNSFESNSIYSIRTAHVGDKINAECNWWGSIDDAVIAGTVSGSVDFTPYLTNGFDNSSDAGFQPKPGSCNGFDYIICKDKKTDKVSVCHNGKTLCIPVNSLYEHLDHGDKLGSCASAGLRIENTITELILPNEYKLGSAPNPFRSTTKLEYSIPVDSRVSIRIYDILGREVSTVVNADRKAGTYTENYDGSKLTTGVYYARMIATADGKQTVQTQKLVRAD